jgi:hypothetical protein
MTDQIEEIEDQSASTQSVLEPKDSFWGKPWLDIILEDEDACLFFAIILGVPLMLYILGVYISQSQLRCILARCYYVFRNKYLKFLILNFYPYLYTSANGG